jgi:hypothetical protein
VDKHGCNSHDGKTIAAWMKLGIVPATFPVFSAKRLKKAAGRQAVNGASAPETPALEGEEQPAAETPD